MRDQGLPWGTDWELHRAVDGAIKPGRVRVTIGFHGGRAGGRAPVNRYFGACQDLGGGSVRIGPLGMTLMAGPPAALAAEAAFVALLDAVRGFRLETGELVLTGADGAELLAFVPVAGPA